MMKHKLSIWLSILFVVILYLIQYYFFRLQLDYGFRDGDWFILYNFKTFGDNPIIHLINSLKAHGVYTYQIYYIGFLEQLLGLNFHSLHLATHIFKFIAALSLGIAIYFITRHKGISGLSAFFFTTAPAAAGAMYMVVTGAYFLAIISLTIFTILYWQLLNLTKMGTKKLIVTTIILYTTIILNPERIYPLLVFIFIIEGYLYFDAKMKKDKKNILTRLVFFFAPVTITLTFYLISFLNNQRVFEFSPFQLIFPNTQSRIELIKQGNWQLLVYPFTSLGSLILPKEYWNLLGSPPINSFINFFQYYLLKILPIFLAITLLLTSLTKKNIFFDSIKIIFIFSLGVFLFYFLSHQWLFTTADKRIHFDPSAILPAAFVGLYVVIISIYYFLIKNYFKERLSFRHFLYLGPLFTSLFIFMTWLPSDEVLLFTGPQRYLTVPAVGISIFMASLIILLYYRIKASTFRLFSLPLIIFIILIIAKINYTSINNFFYEELYFGGMDGKQQTIMKGRFWSLVPNMSNSEPSLFYFDETGSGKYGYFNESTILAGFTYWTRFDGSEAVRTRPIPGLIRTNVNCPDRTHKSCIDILKQNLEHLDGDLVIKHQNDFSLSFPGRYYKLENFYAMRFIENQIIDIREDVLKGINE